MQAPPQLYEKTKENLEKKMAELFEEGDFLDVTDPALSQVAVSLIVKFK
jgi:hypothetical protein